MGPLTLSRLSFSMRLLSCFHSASDMACSLSPWALIIPISAIACNPQCKLQHPLYMLSGPQCTCFLVPIVHAS